VIFLKLHLTLTQLETKPILLIGNWDNINEHSLSDFIGADKNRLSYEISVKYLNHRQGIMILGTNSLFF